MGEQHLRIRDLLPPALLLLLFLALGAYQLRLPGLHYDEAKEAGLNGMQLVTGQPLTPFRDASVKVGPWHIPLMVQDYIGALNVLLAVPFLAVGGVNVVALRWLPLLTGGLTLLLAWRVARRLAGLPAAHATAALLAVSPTFVFWSRQGIFVTNITALFLTASLLTGLRWWTDRKLPDLWLTALFWGLGLYAKLLFIWAIGAMVVTAAAARAIAKTKPRPPAWTWPVTSACFLLPLTPLVIFNLRTEGTVTSIFGNLERSYYGINNRAYLPNLAVRLGQLRTLLRGDHFWYLGEVHANPWAPWLAGGLVVAAVLAALSSQRCKADQQAVLLPVALLVLIVAQSAFTVSDLFITHYALLFPLIPLAGGLAAGALLHRHRLWLTMPVLIALLWWSGADLWTTACYHRALTLSGGHSAHSSAIAGLAAYLENYGPATVVALDWGIDAPVRFLTVGRVSPVEIFGYASLDVPDTGFAGRVAPFMDDPDTIYLAHATGDTVFHGRVEALAELANEQERTLCEQARLAEQGGRPLFVVYRVAAQAEPCN